MAEIFNEQRVLGVEMVADGTVMHNGSLAIGVVDAGAGVLFVDNQRTLGVDVLGVETFIHNEQPVRGAVLIVDGRDLYNGQLVIPAWAVSGALA